MGAMMGVPSWDKGLVEYNQWQPTSQTGGDEGENQEGLLEDETTQGNPEGMKGATQLQGREGFHVEGTAYAKTRRMEEEGVNVGFFFNVSEAWSAQERAVLHKNREEEKGQVTEALGCLNVEEFLLGGRQQGAIH